MKITESALKLLLKEEMKKVLLEAGAQGYTNPARRAAAMRQQAASTRGYNVETPTANAQPYSKGTLPADFGSAPAAPAPQAPQAPQAPVAQPVKRNDEAAVAAAKNVQLSRNGATISWNDKVWRYEVNFDNNFISAGKIGEEMKPVQNAGATQQAWQAIWSVAGMLKARNPAPQLQSGMHNAVSRITNPNAQFISNASTALKGLNK